MSLWYDEPWAPARQAGRPNHYTGLLATVAIIKADKLYYLFYWKCYRNSNVNFCEKVFRYARQPNKDNVIILL